jgi:probable F420-dependent oxidoreductase
MQVADRKFRFGLVATPSGSPQEWTELARRAEDLGFSTLLIPDSTGTLSSFPTLAMAAAVTERLRLGTFVLAAPLRPTGTIVWETATLDQLSGGRFELGLGAGRPDADQDARILGVPFGTPGARVRRVGEIIDTVDRLSRDAVAGTDGLAAFRPVQRPRPPIMVAGGGDRLLTIAARQADIVAVHGDGTDQGLGERVRFVREAAGERFGELELSTNVFSIGDREIPPWLRRFGIDPSRTAGNQNAAVLTGDHPEVIDNLERRRDEFGISYVTINVLTLAEAEPVVARLAGN